MYLFKPRFLVFDHGEVPQEPFALPESSSPVLREMDEKEKAMLSQLYDRIGNNIDNAHAQMERDNVGGARLASPFQIADDIKNVVSDRRAIYKDYLKSFWENLPEPEKTLLKRQKPVLYYTMDSRGMIPSRCAIKIDDSGINVDVFTQADVRGPFGIEILGGEAFFDVGHPGSEYETWKGPPRTPATLLSDIREKMNGAVQHVQAIPDADKLALRNVMNDYVSDYYGRMSPAEKASLLNRQLIISSGDRGCIIDFGINNFLLTTKSIGYSEGDRGGVPIG
jgi:hypothetical protein